MNANTQFIYGQRVRVRGGFYLGQQGILVGHRMSTDVRQSETGPFTFTFSEYSVRMDDKLTEWISQEHLEAVD